MGKALSPNENIGPVFHVERDLFHSLPGYFGFYPSHAAWRSIYLPAKQRRFVPEPPTPAAFYEGGPAEGSWPHHSWRRWRLGFEMGKDRQLAHIVEDEEGKK
jgi:hypothetical protein